MYSYCVGAKDASYVARRTSYRPFCPFSGVLFRFRLNRRCYFTFLLMTLCRFNVKIRVLRPLVAAGRSIYDANVNFVQFMVDERACKTCVRGVSMRFTASSSEPQVVVRDAVCAGSYFYHFNRVSICVEASRVLFRVSIVVGIITLICFRGAVILEGEAYGMVPNCFTASQGVRVNSLVSNCVFNRRLRPICYQVHVLVYSTSNVVSFTI